MKNRFCSLAVLLIFCFCTLFFSAGCSSGRIKSLSPSNPDNTLGQYPAKPDENGMITIRAIGKGIPPENITNKAQASLLAERAAVADGYRQLAEKIKGVYVRSYMKTGNEIVDYDFIQLATETWLRGVQVESIEYTDLGIVEAYMAACIQVHRKNNFPFHLP